MKPSLSDLRAFVTVARHQSFRVAADILGVSRSALSHAMRGLEADLGVRLLHRTTRSVALTEAGARLLARLAPTLQELDDVLATVSGSADEPSGRVRINALEAASRWLMRHVVPRLMARYPRIEVDLVSEDRLIDIIAEGYDAGVRLRESVPQDMIAVPFGGDVRFLAVASPSYLAERDAPVTPDDLRKHRCIRQRLPSGKPYRWEFARGRDEISIAVPGMLTLNHNEMMVEAAIDGLGIAFVPEQIALSALKDGRLCPVLQNWSQPIPGFCLYYPGHRHVPSALRALVDAVRSADAQLGLEQHAPDHSPNEARPMQK
jgi:DNA-binding transcriptional LysR family regulator